MTDLRTAAKQALEALQTLKDRGVWGDFDGVADALRAALVEDAMQKFTDVNQELEAALAEPDGTVAQQSMQTVRKGFGRTMSYLTEVFGVSRQTLYNWLSGEKAPSPEHEGKIHQLEVASQRFMELGFKPLPSQLTRTLDQGKSFLELLAEGGDGATNADKLVKLVQRGQHSRTRLEALLAEPVQEPVWVCPDSAEHRYQKPGHCEDCGKTLVQERSHQPPQRKPLTEEEIWRTYKNLWMFHPAEEPRLAGDVLKFARAIERAHGIGDNT